MSRLALRPLPMAVARPLALLLLGLTLAAAPAAAATARTWILGADGFWGAASNWSPNGIPGTTDSVAIGAVANGHRSILDGNYTVGWLDILGPTAVFDPAGHQISAGTMHQYGIVRPSVTNSYIANPWQSHPGALTELPDGINLQYGSVWTNDGHAVVHSTAGVNDASIQMSNYATFSGSGDVQLNDAAHALIFSPGGYTLTNSAAHTIRGAGRVTLGVTNYGTISADLGAAQPLTISGAIQNPGLLDARNGAKLVLKSGINNGTGRVFANGGDVQFDGGSIADGTLRSAGSSVIETISSGTLSGAITSAAALRVRSGTVLNLAATITDSGTVTVRENGGLTAATLRLANYTTFQGPGDLKLNDPALAIVDSPAGYTLTNAAAHTIHGTGSITVPVTNHGLITGDVLGQSLVMTNQVSNDGTLEGRNGGTLTLKSGITNSGAGTLYANGGDVKLDGASINGGTTTRSGSSVVFTSTGASLANLANTGLLQAQSGGVLSLSGTITNSGTIQVRQATGASLATLRLPNYLTLTGNGDLQLTSPTFSTLDSPAGYTLTQNAGHLTHGTGTITMPFTNHGVVSADAPGQTLTQSNAIANDGVLQATGGGVYVLSSANVNNSGGTLRANGGNVQLKNSRIDNGTITRTGSNIVEVTASSTIGALTHAGFLRVDGNTDLVCAGGTVTNTGTLQVHEPGGPGSASLYLANYTTFTGAGKIELNDSTLSVLRSPAGYTLTNAASHSVVGSGQSTLPLTNAGLFDANVNGQPLIVSNVVSNSGTLRATNGGRLVLSGATLSDTGTVAAVSGDVWYRSSYIQNQQLTSAAGFKHRILDVSGMFAVRNQGTIEVRGGAQLYWPGSTIVNNGTILVRDTTAGTAEVQMRNYTNLSGTGTLRLAHGADAWVTSPAGYSLTHFAGHSIRGTGHISVILNNSGDVWADVKDSALVIQNTNTNSGRYGATNGGLLSVTTTPSNVSGTGLSAGEWFADANSELRVAGAAVQTNAAQVTLQGRGSKFTNNAAGTSALAGLKSIAVGGSLSLRNDRDIQFPTGLTNNGTIVLGDSSDAVIDTVQSGVFTQTVTGKLVFELAGHGTRRCGHLVVVGELRPAGSLTVRTVNGFVPAIGDSFLVIDFGTRNAGFASYDSLNVAPGIYLAPIWRNKQLWLRTVSQPNVGVDPTPGGGVAAAPKALHFGARSGAGRAAALQLDLPTAADVDVALFDIGGRRVAILASGQLPAGRHEWSLESAATNAAGVYFGLARVRQSNGTQELHTRVVTWR